MIEEQHTAVLTVLVGSHEDTSTTGLGGALAAQTLDLAVRVDLVVLEHSKLARFVLVLDLLGGTVGGAKANELMKAIVGKV